MVPFSQDRGQLNGELDGSMERRDIGTYFGLKMRSAIYQLFNKCARCKDCQGSFLGFSQDCAAQELWTNLYDRDIVAAWFLQMTSPNLSRVLQHKADLPFTSGALGASCHRANNTDRQHKFHCCQPSSTYPTPPSYCWSDAISTIDPCASHQTQLMIMTAIISRWSGHSLNSDHTAYSCDDLYFWAE